ncbi:hypothetical protein [Pseudarthrobacter sp. S9]|uniref:hypothetical protein n=1 Tax=Pseudarthrobacter sp. S9 TaxID=3418421 RepID=UPI003CFFAFD1
MNPANKVSTYLLASPVSQVNTAEKWKPVSQVKPVLRGECHAGPGTEELLGSLSLQVNPANKVSTYLLVSPVSQVKKAKTRKPASQVKPVLLATLGSLWKGL